jgi:hypothetical protein
MGDPRPFIDRFGNHGVENQASPSFQQLLNNARAVQDERKPSPADLQTTHIKKYHLLSTAPILNVPQSSCTRAMDGWTLALGNRWAF